MNPYPNKQHPDAYPTWEARLNGPLSWMRLYVTLSWNPNDLTFSENQLKAFGRNLAKKWEHPNYRVTDGRPVNERSSFETDVETRTFIYDTVAK